MPREQTFAESAKQRSLRVPLDHYQRPDLLARVKWKLSALAALAAAIYVAWVLLGGKSGQSHASPGALAAAHAGWNDDCAACHRDFRPLRGDAFHLAGLVGASGDREALDASCVKCHNTPLHHVAAKPGETPSCAACHRDHQGHAADIVRPADAMCLACHRDLQSHRSGSSKVTPQTANIAGFGSPAPQGTEGALHPEFRSLEHDPGNVKFNHWLHLQPGIAAHGAKQKLKLADLDTDEQPKYAKLAKEDGLVQLDCAACHLPQAQGGAYMNPIAYEEHCRACHRLELKLGDSGKIDEVPHGLSATRLTAVLDGLLLGAQAKPRELASAGADESGALPLIPGRTIGTNLAQKIGQDVLGKRANAARAINTKCRQCHEARGGDTAQTEAIEVIPPEIPSQWLRHSRFDHAAHRHVECKNCHPAAYTFEERDKPRFLSPPPGGLPARDNETVMIVGIDECAKCHTSAWGVAGAARYDCAECHNYHGGDHLFSSSPHSFLSSPNSFPGPHLGTHDSKFPASLSTQFSKLQPTIRVAALTSERTFVGAPACASAGCHGNVRPGLPEWRGALNTWALLDPHAQAYDVLWTYRGREMTRLLTEGTGDRGQGTERLSDERHFAVLQERCVGCHATPLVQGKGATNPDDYSLGINCESCHGPAGQWLHPHYQAGFHRDTPGFVNTKENLEQRASTCMKCHVGPSEEFGTPQFVDHDLIAAGHPRLAFEFHAYFESKPAHWNRLVDEARPPGRFHFASWLAGQIQQTQIAQQLVEKSSPNDFALLDCSACHHALAADSWRKPPPGDILKITPWPTIKLPEFAAPPQSLKERLQFIAQAVDDPANRRNWEAAVQSYLAVEALLADLKAAGNVPSVDSNAVAAAVTDFRNYLSNSSFGDRRATQYELPGTFSSAAAGERIKTVYDSLQRLEAATAP